MKLSACLVGALAALSLISAAPACSETVDDAASLTVTLTDIARQSGTIYVGLFAGEADYAGGNGVRGARVSADGETVAVTLENLAPGEYAIKLYQDVNDNGEMDTNPFGMPTEPFAFSNNARGRFGPAKWDAARFIVVAGENSQSIAIGG